MSEPAAVATAFLISDEAEPDHLVTRPHGVSHSGGPSPKTV